MVYLVITSILWALTYGLSPRLLTWLDPLLSATVYCTSSLLLFLPLCRSGCYRCFRLRWVLLGCIQWGLMYFFLQHAFNSLSGPYVALLCTTTPIYLALLADCFSRRFHFFRLLLAVLAVLFVWFALDSYPGRSLPWRGFFWGEGANIAYAIGQLLYRRWWGLFCRRPEDDILPMFWMFLGASLFLLLLCLFFRPPLPAPGSWTVPRCFCLVFLGPICCGLGNYLWNRGILRVSSGLLAIFNNVSIPLGLLFSWLIFKESVDWWRILLALSGLVGLLWINSQMRGGKKS